jgi:Transglycosylase SLT domain
MTRIAATAKIPLLCFFLGLCSSGLVAQTPPSDEKGSVTFSREESQKKVGQIQLRLTDGTFLTVDDAWDSPQGIWYRQAGISHLAPRERVKSVERIPLRQVKPEAEPPKPFQASPQTGIFDKPAWIYLKGGARVEADSATESTAGVWYKHGAMSIFIDRSRIDRIEPEEKLTESESSGIKDGGWSTGRQKLDSLIRQSGSKYGVDPYLIFLVMEQESHFNTRVVSPKGARGLMQLMPGTSARFGVRRPHDPAQNISGGTRYLKQLLDRFSNRVDLVLASYNAGEGAVIKFGHKVPPYRETREYVKRISYRYGRRGGPPKEKLAAAATGGR